jgi:excisionase family DNA binding protein
MGKLADRFVLPAEAAKLLGLTPQRVKQLVDEGRLAAHRIGPRGVRLIERKAVEALIKQRHQAATNGDAQPSGALAQIAAQPRDGRNS